MLIACWAYGTVNAIFERSSVQNMPVSIPSNLAAARAGNIGGKSIRTNSIFRHSRLAEFPREIDIQPLQLAAGIDELLRAARSD